MSSLAEFLSAHDNVRPSGDGFVMRCRAHEDLQASLSAKEADGRVLVHCFAGCSSDEIVGAIGWELVDLFITDGAGDRLAVRKLPRVTRWEVRSEGGDLVAIHQRSDPGKRIWWRQADGRLGLNGMSATSLPLYLSEDAATWDTDASIVLGEGEKAADAVRKAGLPAVGTVCGASTIPDAKSLAVLKGRVVVLWPDNDEAGRSHMAAIAHALLGVAAEVRVVSWPDAPERGDAADIDADTIRQLVAGASRYEASPPAPDLSAALNATLAHLTRYVRFAGPAEAIAVTLWVAHTHVYERGETSPLLWISSALAQSGKTRVFEVIEHLVARPWVCERPSEAVVFRRIDRDHPTMLVDEIDTILRDKSASFEGLRAIFNAGNRRGVVVSRALEAGRTLTDFEIYCPKAVAGLGHIPETMLSRSIPIRMQRRAKHETVERLRRRRASDLARPLRETLVAATANLADLVVEDDTLPEELSDRQQDSWEPLLAIAGAAGPEWLERAGRAAVALHVTTDGEQEDSLALRLLADLRAVFSEIEQDWIKTTYLIEKLAEMDEAPWGDLRGKPITPHYLARLLREFEIRVEKRRIGTETQRGYSMGGFSDAWSRYLPSIAAESATTASSATSGAPTVALASDVALGKRAGDQLSTTSSNVGPATGDQSADPCVLHECEHQSEPECHARCETEEGLLEQLTWLRRNHWHSERGGAHVVSPG